MNETLEERINRVELNAQYWFDAARAEPNRDRAVMNMEQAMFAWKNAAYGLKRELVAVRDTTKPNAAQVEKFHELS